jgi:mannose-6-phosphate isomerase-like protein (cupin superfamily)
VEIGERSIPAAPGEEFVIPAEETHRIRCDGPGPGRILEVAYGYTAEDDDERIEDDYGRPVVADR